ncbi:OmpP1/FadL family transporter [Aureibacter tunicatorum]|uniref:Outer membrane protein transport protein (OMPP1/FadL/TodX) n=1 Tax=Aureibacter tunicatorum TaxID=866807 RepID=A0AAE3XJF0_9BACT|nr:hypothetical protein [Aureibacter tunicatorum]MDR6237128.1 hypothetical protein [Aureibacter tunicatorum]BDD06120.1 hemin receptor [Aureibacter tunicatorum]
MKGKIFFFSLIAGASLLISNAASAQVDYIGLSRNDYRGTARMQGLGGSYTSLGGDATSIVSNPAGLGFYRRSDFNASIGLNFNNAQGQYYGQSTDANQTNMTLSNISYVHNATKKDFLPGDWRGGNWGFSLNRVKDFNSRYAYKGYNSDNDINDFYVHEANRGGGTYSDMAYDAYLIDHYSSSNGTSRYDRYIPGDVPDEEYSTYQENNVRTYGNEYQWTAGYGGNYKNKLFLGASISLHTMYFRKETEYVEEYIETPLIAQELFENYRLNGTGVSGTFGAIYKPTPALNIGVNVKTPTHYWMREEQDMALSSYFDAWQYEVGEKNVYSHTQGETLTRSVPNGAKEGDILEVNGSDQYSPIYKSDWTLSTPWEVSVGASYFIGKHGFITADVEWVDYSAMTVKSNDFDPSFENDYIGSIYQSVFNVKLGGEARLGMFRLRAGYAHYGDPIKDNSGNGAINEYSFGGGIKKRDWYLDFAVTNTRREFTDSPYSLPNMAVDGPSGPNSRMLYTPVADISTNNWLTQVTLGFTF